ncbi:MAG: hypothetical protein IJ069_09615 [Prevotella sp.]|nr:hypothetical protein [Prevotella sp.]
MKKLLFIGVLLAMACGMQAQTTTDYLKVADFELKAGEEKKVEFELVNPEHKYVAFQFDIFLPEGVSAKVNKSGKVVCSLNKSRMEEYDPDEESAPNTILGGELTENEETFYRILAYSDANIEFLGTEGTLLTVTLVASETLPAGPLTVNVKNVTLTSGDGTGYSAPDASFTINKSSDGINEISAEKPATVYDLKGNQVRKNATSVEGLSKGVYIINNKKVIVK